MSNRPELSDLFLWMAIFINFVLNETPCDFSLLAGCRLCAGAYSGEFRLPVRPGVVSCHVFTAGNVLCEIFPADGSSAERRRVLAVICVVASTLIIEWMSLLLASFHTTPSENLMRAPFPGYFRIRFYFDSAGGDCRPGGVAVSLSEKETFRGEICDVYFRSP